MLKLQYCRYFATTKASFSVLVRTFSVLSTVNKENLEELQELAHEEKKWKILRNENYRTAKVQINVTNLGIKCEIALIYKIKKLLTNLQVTDMCYHVR